MRAAAFMSYGRGRVLLPQGAFKLVSWHSMEKEHG